MLNRGKRAASSINWKPKKGGWCSFTYGKSRVREEWRLLDYGYSLRGTLYFACSASDACVTVDDNRLLSFIALHFFLLEDLSRTKFDTDVVAEAFANVDHYLYHDLSLLKDAHS